MKKKLPKAILVSRDEMQAPAVEAVASALPSDCREHPVAPADSSGSGANPAGANSAILVDSPAHNSWERSSGMISGAVTERAAASQRRSMALAIVNRYARYSALGGIIPIPVANFAGVTAVIVRMVGTLSRHYGVAFEHERTRAVVVALVGGAMPTGAAAVATSAMIAVVPPTALVALAVSSMTAAAFTRGVGRIFIEQFERTASLEDVSAAAAALETRKSAAAPANRQGDDPPHLLH